MPRLGKGGDGDDGAGLFSVMCKATMGNKTDDLCVVVVNDASHCIFNSADKLGNVANAACAMLRRRWFELSVRPEVVFRASKNKRS